MTDRLALVGCDGGAAPGAWALGPIVRGVFWECTAVPDIRVQARTVAADVAAQLAGQSWTPALLRPAVTGGGDAAGPRSS